MKISDIKKDLKTPWELEEIRGDNSHGGRSHRANVKKVEKCHTRKVIDKITNAEVTYSLQNEVEHE